MKTPAACASLSDVRQVIDQLDHDIVLLLAKRMQYVKAASRFKPSLESIPAPDRVQRMLLVRERWAEEQQLEGHFIRDIFAQLIQWYIAQQVDYWQQHSMDA